MDSVLTDLAQKVSIPHTAVLVIDMQHVFCSQGDTSTRGADKTAIRAMIPRLQQFLSRVRGKNISLIFVGAVMDEGNFSPPIKELCLRHYGREVAYCLRGSWEAEFIPELQPEAGEIVIEKTRYSAFFKTDLDARLRAMGITTIVVTGVGTNVCVETTCRDAFMRDYYVVVPNDLVATVDEKLHESALFNLNRYFATVTSSAELLRVWGDEAPPRKDV